MAFFPVFKREIFQRFFGIGQKDTKEKFSGAYLVVGLGNPGGQYAKTRHNIGFMVADHLSLKWGIRLDSFGFDNMYGAGCLNQVLVVLAKPQLFMNLSGPAVFNLVRQFGIDRERIVVIHDDLDIPFGKIKIKTKGGHAGHKGIQSLVQFFGGGDFLRLRVGIGRPAAGDSVIDHVLGRFDAKERAVLGRVIELAGNSVETVFSDLSPGGHEPF